MIPLTPTEKRRHLREAVINGIWISILVSILLFAEEIIGPERMERRVESIPLPPCAECEVEVVYSPNESEAPDFPYISGWTCSKPCID